MLYPQVFDGVSTQDPMNQTVPPPIIDHGPTLNWVVLLAAIMILIGIVVVIGRHENARDLRHWSVSVFLAIVMFLLWQGLTVLAWEFVHIHTPFSLEEKIAVINIANGTILLSLALLLAFIQYRRTRNHESVSEE